MPTQLQLEGPELEPLLARVRAEHGSSARIVQAEKVRSGGVGGFFAKARFEITVEVDDAAPTPPRVTSLLDLADEVSDGERAAAVSTESTGFAAVLARLGATAGAPETDPAPLIPVQRQAPSPQTPRRAYDAPVPAEPAPQPPARRRAYDAPAAAPQPPARRRRTDDAPVVRAPGRAPARRTAPVRPPVPVTRPATARAAAPTRRALTAGGAAAVRVMPAPGAAPAPRRPAAPGTAVAIRTPSAVATQPPRERAAVRPRATAARSAGALTSAGGPSPAPSGEVGLQLARLGLPAHLQPTSTGDALHASLVTALRALPKAPRAVDRAGGVLAVVGPAAAATEVARAMARELDLPRSAIVTAASDTTAEQARARRTAWSRRSRTTIVVVDTPLTAAGALHTRALLEVLQPAGTWGVVEATRKAQDVGAWARAVGRVDALALCDVDETADPASVLQLGIPVGRIGSRRATPTEWATLLAHRVAA